MYCPNCSLKFPSGETRCPKCGGSGLPRNTQSAIDTVNSGRGKTVPLNGKQRWSFFLSSLFSGLLLSLPSIIIFGIPLSIHFNWLVFLLGITFISIGMYNVPSVHELIDGNSYIKSVQLIRVDRFHDSRTHCFGFFKELGRLRINDERFDEYTVGALYQINYSPRSKIVWTMHLQSEQIARESSTITSIKK